MYGNVPGIQHYWTDSMTNVLPINKPPMKTSTDRSCLLNKLYMHHNIYSLFFYTEINSDLVFLTTHPVSNEPSKQTDYIKFSLISTWALETACSVTTEKPPLHRNKQKRRMRSMKSFAWFGLEINWKGRYYFECGEILCGLGWMRNGTVLSPTAVYLFC